MKQIIDNLKTLRTGIFKDEQAVNKLIDETLKLAEQKASQFDALVMPKIAEEFNLGDEIEVLAEHGDPDGIKNWHKAIYYSKAIHSKRTWKDSYIIAWADTGRVDEVTEIRKC